MKVKKYYPWQATPNVVTPDVTFYDPTRELAANAEMANIAANSMAQFTGPQAFNARFAETQGNAARNAADILSRYNNLNVGVSNQQAAQNAQIMNQAAQQKAANNTQLWDKYQIVNQQFDNAKNQATDALVNQYTNAITNRAYTANLNQMYPQYAVDPSTGGFMYFKNPRDLNPNFAQEPSANDKFRTIFNDLPPALREGNPEVAANIALKMMGVSSPDQNAFDAYTKYKNRDFTPGYVPGYQRG